MAYPANGKLFFCTTTEIHPEQELLFYYSRDYCRLMGEMTDDVTWIVLVLQAQYYTHFLVIIFHLF